MIKRWQVWIIVGLLLLTSGLLVLVIPHISQDRNRYIKGFIRNLELELAQCDREFEPFLRRLEEVNLLKPNFLKHTSSFRFFIFTDDRLMFWSDNIFVPNINEIRSDKELVYYEHEGLKTLIRQWTINSGGNQTRLLSLIPLIYEPPVSNQYLQIDWNSRIIQHPNIRISDQPGDENAPSFTYNGEYVLTFDPGENYRNPNTFTQYLGTILTLTGLAVLFIFIFSSAYRKIENSKTFNGFLRLIVGWVGVFVMIRIITDNGYASAISLFNSRVYASSWFLNNLMQLLLFGILILTLAMLFVRISLRPSYLKALIRLNTIARIALSVISVVLLYYLVTFHFLVFRDIYDNSQISLDINNSLILDAPRISALFVFTVNSISLYLLFHAFLRTWLIVTRKNYYWILGALVFGTLLYLVFENDFPVVFMICVLAGYLLLIFWSKLHTYFFQFNYRSLLYFFSSAILSCTIAAYSIQRLEAVSTVSELKSYADSLMEVDNFAVFLVNEAVEKIKDDPFISNWMTSPFVSKEIISRKINQLYLGRYLSKYDVNIYLFDQQGKSFINPETSRNYSSIHNRYAVGPNSTNFNDIYVIGRSSGDPFYKRYQAFIDIRRYEAVVGHIVLDLRQKRAIQRNVYPELLIDRGLGQYAHRQDVSYAVYSGTELIYNVGDYNYPSEFNTEYLSLAQLFEDGIQRKGILHVAQVTPRRTTVVISTKGHTPFEIISNFSYLLPILIFVYGLTLFVVSAFRFMKGMEFGYATRIQVYINVAFILPLLFVSITTLSLLSSSSRANIQNEYIKKGNDLSNAIQQRLDNFLVDPSQGEDLIESLRNTSELLNTDADLYNFNGGLIVSTQPDIYNMGLISRFIKPEAYDHLIREFESAYIDEYQVGKLNYNITFIPVKTSDTGRIIGILSLPFFEYHEILEGQQIKVLVNILNIFSLLFITLLIFSYFASKRLVDPLKLITDKLNKMSFTGYNEPIDWNSNDELGRLVGEYNSMIMNLEDSRQKLARNQRELAWREIAQHVAHEIKNPLTPMKLTLQQLQRRLSGKTKIGSGDVEKPVTSLLHQVEVLKDIAASFSSFAKMPIPEMKRFDIIAILKQSFDLHKNERDVNIRFRTDYDCLYTLGDEKLMGRIVTNIILNAIQSSDKEKIRIEGSAKLSGQNVLIEISDNGPGIESGIHDKIFLPGFSTKPTGSGIGLAIAKHGIEQSGGQIWFESDMENGTSFFIELPLLDE